MQTAKDLQKNIFSECKNIINHLSQVSNIEELLSSQHLVSQLLGKISVLEFIETYESHYTQNTQIEEETPTEPIFIEDEIPQQIDSEDENPEEEPMDIAEYIEEESIIEIVQEDSEDISFEMVEEEPTDEQYQENPAEELQAEEPQIEAEEELSTEITFELMDNEEWDTQEIETPQVEEISEIEVQTITDENKEEESSEQEGEEPIKKIKLAKIKTQYSHIDSLFDEQTLNEIIEIPEPKNPVEPQRREFVLDLNDRIAFSKMLFGGSQNELNNVVRRLNAFKNVDDAKQYLSDMYYEKNWDKVDEYAQRLWVLVENKFL